MQNAPLATRIVDAFASMPAQLQSAAQYILDRPHEVALLSMRDQAKQAGVQPATMTRLAKRLGLEGYDDLRDLYAEAIRNGGLGFSGKAGAQVATQKAKGERALAIEIVGALSAQVGRLAESEQLDRLIAATDLICAAERVYCLGLRSSYVIAWHVNYVLSLIGDRTILLDSVAGVGTDPIRSATAKDVLFVISIAPYTRATIKAAEYAHAQGIPIVAITDSAVSPLALMARSSILIGTEGPSFFHSITSATAAGEILVALVAGRGGEASTKALTKSEKQLAAFNIHWNPQSVRRNR